jgi:hypothetical protein
MSDDIKKENKRNNFIFGNHSFFPEGEKENREKNRWNPCGSHYFRRNGSTRKRKLKNIGIYK